MAMAATDMITTGYTIAPFILRMMASFFSRNWREPQQNRVENTARLTRRHHVHEQIVEGLGVFAQRVGQRMAALDVVHHLPRDVGQDLVFGLLGENVRGPAPAEVRR